MTCNIIVDDYHDDGHHEDDDDHDPKTQIIVRACVKVSIKS